MGERALQTPRTAEARKKLDAISRSVEGTFTHAADALISGRENLAALTVALRRYCDGLLAFAGSDVAQTVVMLADRFGDAETAHAEETATIDRLSAALARTGAPLDDLHGTVRTIEMFASTARVVETETDIDGNLEFSSEIKTLSVRSRAAYQDLMAHRSRLLSQADGIRAEQSAFAQASLSNLGGLGLRLRGLAGVGGPRIDTAAHHARQVVGAVDGATGRMSDGIAALQVGDSFRQRVEHVCAMLGPELPDPITQPGAHALVLRLAAAQLAGAGLALDVDLSRLTHILADASIHSGRLLRWCEALSGQSEATRFLEDLRDLCGAGLAALYSSQVQRRALGRQMAALRDRIEAMREGIGALAHVDSDMRLGSLNVLLRSQKAQRNGPAMMHVARQFGELTNRCSEAQRGIVAELQAISGITSTAIETGRDQVGEELDRIAASLGGLGEMLELWTELRVKLDGILHRGPEAMQDFSRCAEEMKAQRVVAGQIAALARALTADLPPDDPRRRDPVARAVAARIRTLYSVPEERAIHDRLCPDAAGAEVVAAEAVGTAAAGAGTIRTLTAGDAAVGVATEGAAESGAEDDFEWF